MGWTIIYERQSGAATLETTRTVDPLLLDRSLAAYAVPAELQGRNGEQLWKSTHVWDTSTRSLIPMPPKVESQDRKDLLRLRADGVVTDADLKKAVELLLKAARDNLFT